MVVVSFWLAGFAPLTCGSNKTAQACAACAVNKDWYPLRGSNPGLTD